MQGFNLKENLCRREKITFWSVQVTDQDPQLQSLGGKIQNFSIMLKVR